MTQQSKPVLDVLDTHVTVRSFSDRPLSDELLNTILNAARRSPTSSNMQTYSIVVVRDSAVRQQLAKLAGNQRHIETCQAFVGFCADIHRIQLASQMHEQRFEPTLELMLVASIDAALVGMSAQLAAESVGLGAVMVGGMRNYPKKVAELLGLPSGVYMVYGMSIGWPNPEHVPPQKPRLPEELVIHEEQYNDNNVTALLQEYDVALANYYNARGRNLHEAAWSWPIATRLSEPVRPHLRDTLEELGFNLD